MSPGSLHSCRLIVEIAGERCIWDQDNQGRSALHLATMGGHGDVVNYLLEKGGKLQFYMFGFHYVLLSTYT